jgi:hypothetical protein
MAIQIIGYSGVIGDVDGTVYRALKVTQRPTEYGMRGSYRLSVATSAINATLSNGSLFQFYWPSTIANALIWGLWVNYSGSSPTSDFQLFRLMFERLVSGYGSGGSLITVPGTTKGSQQLRTSMRPSLAAPVRVATTAALTNGTWAEDANPHGSFTFVVNGTGINTNYIPQMRLFGSMSRRNKCPIVMGANEALNVTLTTATTPTFVVGLTMAWTEIGSY